jgi:hypothetical protein
MLAPGTWYGLRSADRCSSIEVTMPTLTISRSDLWPVGTTVGVYPPESQTPNAPGAAAITTGVVAADGSLSITNAGILAGTTYVCAAQVGGVWQSARARSTLDTFDAGTAAGVATTANGSPNLSAVSASSGAFAVGQLITGPGIPPQTRLISGSGAAWVMSAAATADAVGVPVVAYGARVPVAVLGSTVNPQTQASNWAARLRQRRVTAGTS